MPKSTDAFLSPRPFISDFWMDLERAASPYVSELTNYVVSNQDEETYRWLDNVPGMEEWRGTPIFNTLGDFVYRLRNKDFQDGLLFKKKEWRQDSSGQIKMRVGELADAVAEWPEKRLSEIIDDAEVGLCYDGKPFFAADHPDGAGGTNSNIFEPVVANLPVEFKGTAAAPSAEAFAHMVLAAAQEMFAFKMGGRPINRGAKSFIVMVPVQYMAVASSALTKSTFAGGVENPLKGSGFTFKLEVNPWLTKVDAFMLFNTQARMRPFVHQVEQPPQTYNTKPGDADWELNRRLLFSVNLTAEMGYFRWQGAIIVKPS